SLSAIKKAVEVTESGYSMAIFPEGTRSKGHKMGEFKSGAFRVAEKAKLPIVPLAIDGTYKIMEANGNFIKAGRVTLTILPPILTESMDRAEIRELEAVVYK
ncbi:MAG: lysophospholipid acyltransferase family protein, partial [Oscillospiraceae bacterium]